MWLDDITATVNNGPFGVDAVNNTIVQFYTSIENGVHSTFGCTAFAAPIIEFLRCVASWAARFSRSRAA